MLVIWLSLSTDVMAKLLAVGVSVFCLWTQLALVQLAPAFVGWQNTRRESRFRGACEASKIEVSVFSDLAWPWCYIGMKNLDAAVDKFGKERVEVTWLPYIIDPGTAAGGEEYLAYNKRRWGSDGWTYSLKEQGRRVGAPFENWKWWPNTLKAHCLVHLAQTKGIASATVKAALFEALYEQGANLSSPKVLSQIAQKLGLSEVEVMEYLESGKGEQEVLQLVRAGQDVVQGGVPFFIVRGAGQPLGFSGAQPSEQLVKILEKASEE